MVGPKEIAKAFEMKETAMSRRGIGYIAADGSWIKNYGQKNIVGYTFSLRMQCADVKKVLGSVHKMNGGATWSCWTVTGATCRTRRRTRRP